jgi:hypothetical protein
VAAGCRRQGISGLLSASSGKYPAAGYRLPAVHFRAGFHLRQRLRSFIHKNCRITELNITFSKRRAGNRPLQLTHLK